jgi:hypothetical protein
MPARGPPGEFDRKLRDRVSAEMARMAVALDGATTSPSLQTMAELRLSCDRLMRATARILMELERVLGNEKGRRR